MCFRLTHWWNRGENRRSVGKEMAEMGEVMNRIARALNKCIRWRRRWRRRARVSDSLVSKDQMHHLYRFVYRRPKAHYLKWNILSWISIILKYPNIIISAIFIFYIFFWKFLLETHNEGALKILTHGKHYLSFMRPMDEFESVSWTEEPPKNVMSHDQGNLIM